MPKGQGDVDSRRKDRELWAGKPHERLCKLLGRVGIENAMQLAWEKDHLPTSVNPNARGRSKEDNLSSTGETGWLNGRKVPGPHNLLLVLEVIARKDPQGRYPSLDWILAGRGNEFVVPRSGKEEAFDRIADVVDAVRYRGSAQPGDNDGPRIQPAEVERSTPPRGAKKKPAKKPGAKKRPTKKKPKRD